MLFRRKFLIGLGMAIAAPRLALGQDAPKLFRLAGGVTSQGTRHSRSGDQHFERSIEGWLVCNFAEVSRVEFPALFGSLGEREGPGDGKTTFNLPDLPCEYGLLGAPIRGTAICPGIPYGPSMPYGIAGEVMRFDIDSNL